ncbi:acyltransferase [Flagellimonas sp. HMM57]|uniref:acyltransferase family protein n=1 Tax=unclassified Flagellimonas TaxID=2644544 RepID=UPI0013D7B7B6|nr:MULTISPECIES: acyltransferase [unclassified Flagellimonas]UII77381.1 acyltransferase [Flagellimonas sp. HMM57]
MKKNKRNSAIDVVRGLCILAVILLHLNIQVPFKDTFLGTFMPKKLYTLFFWSGYYGVIVFFTLSGYLITNSTLKKWGNLTKIKASDFYILRIARIMPLLLALLAVLAVLHLMSVPGFVINEEQTSLGTAIFSVLTFHMNHLQLEVGYLPGSWDILWSISIEESFYLVFPLLCLIVRKEWHFAALVLIFLFISPWARTGFFPENELGDRNHLAYLDAIGIGCITSLAVHRIKELAYYKNIALVNGLALIVLVLFFRGFVYRSGLASIGLNVTLLSLGTGLLVIWMHYRHISGKQKNYWLLNGIRKMGILSYEMYLTHMFIIIALVGAFNKIKAPKEAIYVLYLSTIILSFLLAKYINKWLTKPINYMIRRKHVAVKSENK